MVPVLSLLRGINVSGQKLVKMADLRELYSSLGLAQVKSYIQSGNVVFACPEDRIEMIGKEILAAIKRVYNFEVPIQTYTLEEWKAIAKRHPLMEHGETEEKYKHVTLLGEQPDPERLATLTVPDNDDGAFEVIDEVIYLSSPSGYGRTKLSNNFFESKLKVQATTRNWRTVGKLLSMLEEVQV
ncbi:MAG: DUF1697 domain-containing protein [Calditrichota bacterium]